MLLENPFPEPQRQAPAALVFLLGNVLRGLARQLWVIVLIVLFNPKKRIDLGWLLFFIGLGGLGALMALLSWLNYYFYIRDEQLVLDKGVFRKTRISVPLDRIQTVNFRQTFLHQLLGVVAVEIDTAGSVSEEFYLHAITRQQADALRDYIEAFTPAAARGLVPPDQDRAAPTAAPELLFSLTPMDLLKIGLSQNHLRTAGIIMAFAYSFLDDVASALDIKLEKELEKLPGMASDERYAVLMLWGLAFFILLSMLISLAGTLLRHYGLGVFRTNSGLKMVSGLFDKREVSASFRKIQFMRWSDNPLKRVFGMSSVRLPQAASVEMGRKTTFSIPGCYHPHRQLLTSVCFPKEGQRMYTMHGVHARIIWRQVWLQAILPVAVLFWLTRSWEHAWMWTLWLPAGVWLAVRYHRMWRWEISPDSLRAHWGVVHQRHMLLELFRVQGVSLRDNWFLRRRGLAHLEIYTAAGHMRIPYLPKEKALALMDYLLYRVEADGREWM
ncbi:MAG: hypothetical protein KatS3mg029_0278 [Saprospiraceae bacterium]|nr:MAG: hypothetical protein KatS3mg029_0278 [Saprospiraceae bacterium]